VVVVFLASGTEAAAQIPDSLPPGVTQQMVRNGQLLFEGPGLCTSCHRRDGKGIVGTGADLTDDVWIHSDGSFEAILGQIKSGIPKEHSEGGSPMPERGASRLTENQLRAIAAYVWTLSRRPAD
jgi:mono/diheme cytochrome c family protein